MLITTNFGNFHLGFRYIDNITVATIDPLRDDGKPLRSGRLSGVAYYNPKDRKDGLTRDHNIGRKVAITKAFAHGWYDESAADEFITMYEILSKVRG